MISSICWLTSTIGKRGYIADYLREANPKGSRIIGTGNEYHTPGFMSCDKSYLLPSIDEKQYLQRVLEVCLSERVDSIITLSDLDVEYLSTIRDDLTANGTSCFFPHQDVVNRFLDKYLAYQYFHSVGIKTPKTFTDLNEAEKTLGYPFVVKPRKGSASFGYALHYDEESARLAWNVGDQPIAQEYLDGQLINVEACSAPDGKLLGYSVWERKLSIAGETLLAETIENSNAVELLLSLLEQCPIAGPIDIDMIATKGGLYILEINTRFGGGYPVSHLAGAAFPEAMVCWLNGKELPALDKYKRGVKMVKKLMPIVFNDNSVEVGS